MPAFDYYVAAFKKYAEFHGRARRKEYWFFLLFNIVISIGLSVVDGVTGTMSHMSHSSMGLLSSMYSLAAFIPGLAVTARRLHDTNRSAWWMLIVLLPIIGWIMFLVFLASDSQTTENQYGACPK